MTSAAPQVHKGLAGVVADTTAISTVDNSTNSLLYRGYPVQELAQSCSFLEVAHLLWRGELPTAEQLRRFATTEASQREVGRTVRAIVHHTPENCHPMDVLRTAVSYLGADDPTAETGGPEVDERKALSLLAKLPTVVALDQRRRRGQEPIPPDPELGYVANFFHMTSGSVPDRETLRCFEISLILYAEHSFNASTFTARVVPSTLADLYSSVTAAIGALKGPLHGGANEAVMHMLTEIGRADHAEQWLHEALEQRRKIMGFGHRVYQHGDSRVPIMQKALEEFAAGRDASALMALHHKLETVMLREKGIHPNLDYLTGPAYHLMGFDIPTFTPLFVMSRITGWAAHIIEQASANSLIRPLSAYGGPVQRHVPLPAQRLVG
ncbi:bifunctional 2-methylcitrate synthase/citrate synthase [Saccharopolyspora spinosa]|uniref:Citrate synthase n=1 Tax=Saccharopolyspora spinosa TaxID=60894 RepID=A0A2N3Y0Z0_SACSN|nr:bifunctional 2-methylcitrate synthase/citrate synthase [Saccharopolyspora spinosa]PKW16586.1 citrate synthase [Saccharopolyspora spinosa]